MRGWEGRRGEERGGEKRAIRFASVWGPRMVNQALDGRVFQVAGRRRSHVLQI